MSVVLLALIVLTILDYCSAHAADYNGPTHEAIDTQIADINSTIQQVQALQARGVPGADGIINNLRKSQDTLKEMRDAAIQAGH